MTKALVKAENLTGGYDQKFYIKDIDFEIEHGEFTGIIGPNGSGKTTLLRSLSRAIKPTAGRILVDGTDIWRQSGRETAQKIAVVSQNIETGPISVYDYVLMGRLPFFKGLQFFETREDEEIAEKYIGLTGITGFKNKSMEDLSGGEKQLAQIARALAQQPKLLLLDEPTSHLDIRHQIEILDKIRSFNREFHLTVVVVLHDLNLAGEYCDKIILLKDGRIFKKGTPFEVLTYSIIEEVYQTVVIVEKNPLSKKPYILLVPEEERVKYG